MNLANYKRFIKKQVILRKIKRVWVLKTIKEVVLSLEQKEIIEKKCKDFINLTFKPKVFKIFKSYKDERRLKDIYCKWQRNFFYFIAVIKDQSPDAINSEYEDRIVRLEPKIKDKFYLSYLRYTGEWFDITHGEGFVLKDCLKSILNMLHFFPV